MCNQTGISFLHTCISEIYVGEIFIHHTQQMNENELISIWSSCAMQFLLNLECLEHVDFIAN